MEINFFYNGLKVNGGKLQKAFYSIGNYTEASGIPEDTITITVARGNNSYRFSNEVREAFAGNVKNETDPTTDYFDVDRIRVHATHPLYAQVKMAHEKRKAKYEQG